MSTVGNDPAWFITGCSTGFGRELAALVLSRGGRAVVTARDPATLHDLVESHGERCLALRLDITKPDQVSAAVRDAENKFGRIDVLVNNAGYGYLAALEEGEEAEYRKLFETNLFGLIAMTQAVLPGMRKRKQGHIINMSSIFGFVGGPSVSFYAATKFAIDGISESAAGELRPLGISMTIVAPTSFRTDFSGSSLQTARTSITDYAETAGARIAYVRNNNGKQSGDPKRAAAAIIEVVYAPEPPLRLFLGGDAVDRAQSKIAMLSEEIRKWESLSRGADFPQGE
jgi:NAD(P)-dependent dehydrogenase (short-subunit alcohol dehydrogenase family)